VHSLLISDVVRDRRS